MGNPCAQGDVASQGALVPEMNLGLGNPIHLLTGNKYLFEQDVPPLPSNPLLTVARHYNSLDPRHGALGRGWTLSFDSRLHSVGKQVQIVQADGSRVSFPFPKAGIETTNARGSLRRHEQGWTWHWPNGQRLDFDAQGRLIALQSPIPRPGKLHIKRHEAGLLHGLIAQLRDDTGQEIRMHYRAEEGQAYLTRMDTPLGVWRYEYETAGAGHGLRLISASDPAGRIRRYLYESERQSGNHWLPTGISETHPPSHDAIRLRTWHYDALGRVIKVWQAPADPGMGGLSISYSGSSHSKNDRQTQILSAGGRRLSLLASNSPDRHALSGAVLTLGEGNPSAPEGWPGLVIHYDAAGRRSHWHSPLTGRVSLRYTPQGLLASAEAADGRRWRYDYDALHRLIGIEVAQQAQRERTRLHWYNDQIVKVEHSAESETLIHDEQGRLATRQIARPSLPESGQLALHYEERFEYDANGRLAVHHLPEGGSLHYRWLSDRRLASLEWEDKQGQRHRVVSSAQASTAYWHGNGLYTQTNRHDGVLTLSVRNGSEPLSEPLWVHLRSHDAHGHITHMADWHGQNTVGQGWRFHHDQASRLVRAAPVILPPVPADHSLPTLTNTTHTPAATNQEAWYAWHADGGLAAARPSGGASFIPRIGRNAAGLPLHVGKHHLRYGPSGRLVQLVDNEGRVAQYSHNAHGYRISAQQGSQATQYLYVGQRLAAEIRTQTPGAEPGGPSLSARHISRRYLYAGQALIGLIDYDAQSPEGRLYAVHVDPLGTPRMVTDPQRRVRWLAHYSPTGELTHKWGDLDLALRLPGQIADPFTGWHDNLLRNYVPAMGAYLEPDPMGPVPGQQALGYAHQQPQRHIDPTGLLLFAFDGTRQDALNRANVWKMSQRYADGLVHYHAGPSNPYYVDLDAIGAYSAFGIVTTQWQQFLDALRLAPAGVTLPIDVIGYSRGAALARHFGNMVAQHTQNGWFSYAIPGQGLLQACVDLRFMGLFDTVAQLGLHGSLNRAFDFSINPAWTRVAHAVALHEYRSWFPLTSTSGSSNNNIIEVPFVGGHANVGGGQGPYTGLYIPASSGDLSDVALNWMLAQGGLAGVNWLAGPLADQQVTDPILHDDRPSSLRWLYDGDRRVDDAFHDMLAWRQDSLDTLGAPHRQSTEAFIQRFEDWRAKDGSAVGEVDMAGYTQWLQETLGWAMP